MGTSDAEHALEDIAVRDTRVSDAIDEPMRAMILDILADETLTAGEVHERLGERGIDRTENTVRHHINELRDAGLVQASCRRYDRRSPATGGISTRHPHRRVR